MMTGNTAIHIASQLQSGAPRKAAFLVAVLLKASNSAPGSSSGALAEIRPLCQAGVSGGRA
jgi:hypothetical protein